MARISGINIPDGKRVVISLTYIFGIGRSTAEKMLDGLKIDQNKKTKDLDESEIDKIRNYIEKNLKIEGDLKSEVAQNIRRLKDISSYRGIRHGKNLPVRGQRTKTNARTKRGKRVTVGSGRKRGMEKT